MPATDTQALLALALFRVDPRSAECRNIIHQSLVQIAVFTSDLPLTWEQIYNKVLDILEQSTGISLEECVKATQACLEQDKIEQTGQGYSLSLERRESLLKQADSYAEDIRSFDEELLQCVESELGVSLDDIDKVLLCSTVKNVIQRMFYEKSVELKRVIADGSCDYRDILAAGSTYHPIDALVRELEPMVSVHTPDKKNEIIAGVRTFLANLSNGAVRYLISLHHRAFYPQLLNIDPNLISLQKRCFENVRLYLDTNVVTALLFEAHPLHNVVKDILTACETLQIKLCVSPITYSELVNKISQSKSLITAAGESRATTLIADTMEGRRSEPIIATFVMKKRLQENLSWGGFIGLFEDMETYLMHCNVRKENEEYGDVRKHEHYPSVWQTIRDVRAPFIPDTVVDHDADNFILIHKLRGRYAGNPVLGPGVWLLTMDHNLKIDVKRLAPLFAIEHSKLIEEWGQLLLPFQSMGQFIFSEYISYLVISRLGALVQSPILDFNILKIICNPEFSLDDFFELPLELQLKIVSGIQNDRSSLELLAQAAKTVEAEGKIKIADAFRSKELEILADEKARVKDKLKQHELAQALSKAGEQDKAVIKITKKLKATEERLKHYESMSFWDKLKTLFKRQ